MGKRMIIIGLGTGRCGTLSLAKMLNSQNNCEITHEQKPILEWYGKDLEVVRSRIAKYQKLDIYAGDVSSAYLNYVEDIYEIAGNEVRFICLERDKEENIKSWLRKTKYNYWSKYAKQDKKWSKIFPKYEEKDRSKAISMYWEEYKSKSDSLEKLLPVFRKFKTEDLNKEEKLIEMLDFCQINSKNLNIIHINKSK